MQLCAGAGSKAVALALNVLLSPLAATAQAEADLRTLLSIPDNYKVLFMQAR